MLDISTQAYVYTISLVISTLLNFIIIAAIYGISGILYYLMFTLISFPFVLLMIYNIDCLTTGGCNIWSWIVTVFSCLSLLFQIVIITMSATTKSTNPSQNNLKTS